jgi:cytochrome d ubiquinol oxidase subunit I
LGIEQEPAMDALLLSRIQFAANISFHILFPTITIALGWLLLWFRLARFNRTGDQAYMDAYFFWVKVFRAVASPWAWSPASP